MKIYATNQNGDGHVQQLADQDFPIEIRVGMFASDVVITVEEDCKQLKISAT